MVAASGSVLHSSNNAQDGTGDPYESIPILHVGEHIVIVKYSGADRYLSLTTGRGILANATSGSVRGHNAAGAANALSIAATPVTAPPVPFVGGSANPIENFSSDGPRHVFYNADGSAITPGLFSNFRRASLQKPDLTAADGVSSSVPGFSVFFGTSAAAPHAAAIAGLLWSYNPFLTAGQVRSTLSGTALDIETPGWDRDSGSGIVMAYPAIASAAPQLHIERVELHDANTNGVLDANDCADLIISLQNFVSPAGQSVTGITAVLTCSTPVILVDPAPRTFTDLPPDTNFHATNAFRISTTPLYTCGGGGAFVLQVTTSNRVSLSLPFQLDPLSSGIGPAIPFASSAVPLFIPDLSTVESTVSVSGVSFPLADVQVGMYLPHPYDSDLRVSLVGPDGTTVLRVSITVRTARTTA